MMKMHHYSTATRLLSALTVFLLCYLVFFRLAAFHLATSGSGAESIGDTGIIFSVLSVSALFAQVCYGFIQDRLGLRKHLLWFITALLILSGPAYLLFSYLLSVNILLGSVFGGLFIGLTFNGGIGVLESYTERVARQSTSLSLGGARMWGSLGWAVATFFAGLLFNINPDLNFAGGFSCSGSNLLHASWPDLKVASAPASHGETRTLALKKFLWKTPCVCLLCRASGH